MKTKTTYGSLVREIADARRGTYETAAMVAIVASEHNRSPLAERIETELTPAQAQLCKLAYECDDLAKSLRRASLEAADRMSISLVKLGATIRESAALKAEVGS